LAEELDGVVIVKHFVGTNYDSFFWRKMLSRICRELSRHVIGGLRAYEPPDTPARLLAEFPRMLSLVSKRRTGSQRCVVILDGVNQLFDEDHASNMKWIPATLPPHVRVIVATADGSESSKRMQAHVPPPVVNNINPLTVEECKELVRKSLAMHHKKLSEDAGDALLGDQVGAPSCCVSGNLARLPACMHTVLRVLEGRCCLVYSPVYCFLHAQLNLRFLILLITSRHLYSLPALSRCPCCWRKRIHACHCTFWRSHPS